MEGAVIKASLSGGVEVKLNSGESVEDIRVGNFATVEGKKNKFFSIISDVKIDAVNPKLMIETPADENGLLAEILEGDAIFGVITVEPMIMLEKESGESKTVKTIPSHGSKVKEAIEEDIFSVFGEPDKTHFALGTPLEMDIPVCIDLQKLVERSNGIFGKAGTGKTFLTRLVLAGTMANDAAVNLIFDAHNEYGWEAKKEGGSKVKGLKQLFGNKLAVFTLDPESSRRRKVPVDYEVYIPFKQIDAEDIGLLQSQLNLNNTALESIYQLQRQFGLDKWLTTFLRYDTADLEELAEEIGGHSGALQALRRKLEALNKLSFLRESAPYDAVEKIMAYLSKGIHVVIEFGNTKTLGYMLVANILTRRIHNLYVTKMEEALANGDKEPTPLMITIEEAHRFLSSQLSKETIFGTIAREMRKYNVTLLVVDQRTSGIDSEVMSQIGTKITCQLQDEHDVDSLLMGVSKAHGLKNILASLDSKQQAMILGHAVPMPVVIKTRNYDEKFYAEIGSCVMEKPSDEAFTQHINELWGD